MNKYDYIRKLIESNVVDEVQTIPVVNGEEKEGDIEIFVSYMIFDKFFYRGYNIEKINLPGGIEVNDLPKKFEEIDELIDGIKEIIDRYQIDIDSHNIKFLYFQLDEFIGKLNVKYNDFEIDMNLEENYSISPYWDPTKINRHFAFNYYKRKYMEEHNILGTSDDYLFFYVMNYERWNDSDYIIDQFNIRYSDDEIPGITIEEMMELTKDWVEKANKLRFDHFELNGEKIDYDRYKRKREHLCCDLGYVEVDYRFGLVKFASPHFESEILDES